MDNNPPNDVRQKFKEIKKDRQHAVEQFATWKKMNLYAKSYWHRQEISERMRYWDKRIKECDEQMNDLLKHHEGIIGASQATTERPE